MNREALIALANEAARDPSRAARLAGWIADELRDEAARGPTATPAGYLYAPAHSWIVQARDLDVEPLPTPTAPGRGPITGSVNDFVPLRVPFDALIVGLAGWAQAIPIPVDGEVSYEDIAGASGLVTALEGRDLFSTAIGLDGQVSFGTDGRNQIMLPASVVVGTRKSPRKLAWTVRRNQQIQVRFRNITNVPINGDDFSDQAVGIYRVRAAVAFYPINLERS